MFEGPLQTQLEGCREALAGAVATLDVDEVPARHAPGLWSAADRLERLAAAVKLLITRRVDDSGIWRDAGHRDAAEWIALQAGSSMTAARAAVTTSKRLAQLPATATALRGGDISPAQAEPIADAASHAPEAESKLLDLAGRSSLAELRAEAGRAKAGADPDPDATRRRIHRQRRVQTYTDAEGAWCLRARGPVDAGSIVETALGPIIDDMFHAARKEGRRERREAYMFDALVVLARRNRGGSGDAVAEASTSSNPKFLGLLRLDLEALVRGAVDGDELCEITGLGPVPVTRARELLGESILKLVLTKGTDVASIVSLGRGPTAAQRIALLWSSPLCTVEGCPRMFTQHDHRDPFAHCRVTELANLDKLCDHHHDLKTRLGWALVEGTGKRPMVPPRDARHPNSSEARHKPTAA